MQTLALILGILAGVVSGLAVFILGVIVGYRHKQKIEDTIEKIATFEGPQLTTERAEILPTGDTQTDALEQLIADNDSKGRSTPIKDLQS